MKKTTANALWNGTALVTITALSVFWAIGFIFRNDTTHQDAPFYPFIVFVSSMLTLAVISVVQYKNLSRWQVWGGLLLAAIVVIGVTLPNFL